MREIFRNERALHTLGDALDFLHELARSHAQAGAFLFTRSSRVDGNFLPNETVLAFEPIETVRVRNGIVDIDHAGEVAAKRESKTADSFSVLQEKQATYRMDSREGLPPGILGYVSFESARYLEKVLRTAPGSFSDLGSNDSYDAEFMVFSCFLVIDHKNSKMRAIAVGTEPDGRLVDLLIEEMDELLEEAVMYRAKSTNAISHELQSDLHTTEMKSLQGREGFLKKIGILKHHISEGDIFQAVLSERFETPFHGDPVELYDVLSKINPAPYQFCFLTGKRAFLGASPEMLLKVQGKILETHPIAGTRPRGKNQTEEQAMTQELLASEKEKAEHLMLVDLARNDIGKVAEVGSVFVDSFQQVEKFGGVMHLVSKVKGTLKAGSTAVEAFASCFPAGTLSGAPKIRALQLLSEMEPERRGFYGGAVVLASFNGDFDSCISIRSIEIANAVAKVQAGAGIVADSIAESEYEEVQHKTKVARRALAIVASRTGGLLK